MTEVYGYLLNEKARYSININSNAPAKLFSHTKEQYAYIEKVKKIAMLLILSDSIKRTEFEIDETKLFEELGRISYENFNIKINDMKEFGKNVLLEQAIIAIVSNWESYFSMIFKKIFNDNEFIKWCVGQKEKSENPINKFNLSPDFQEAVTLNKNKFDDLNFGTHIIKKRRINFQNLKEIKSILKLLGIDIVHLSNNWKEIGKFVEARHILVHSANDSIEHNPKFEQETKQGKNRLSDVYTKIEIETIMKDMGKMISEIDMKLFEMYDNEFIKISDE